VAVAVRLELACTAFFRRVQAREERRGYPRFRGVGRYNSLTFPQILVRCRVAERARQGSTQRLLLDAAGKVRVVWHRPLAGMRKIATIRQHRSGKGFVSRC
jgi:putative transposase